MSDFKDSIVYWVGYVEEANKHIQYLSNKRSRFLIEERKKAELKRDQGLEKIAELGGSADFIRSLFGERKSLRPPDNE